MGKAHTHNLCTYSYTYVYIFIHVPTCTHIHTRTQYIHVSEYNIRVQVFIDVHAPWLSLAKLGPLTESVSLQEALFL